MNGKPEVLTLYPHQKQAIDLSLLKFQTDRYALLDLFVGAGKSYIMSEMAKKYKRVVVLQPCLELVEQNHSKLATAGLDTTMIDSTHKGSWETNYIYTTPQTLVKSLEKLDEPDLLIIDEANVFYEGKMFKTIFSKWKKCKVLALTATPYYYERKSQFSNGWIYSVTTIKSIEDVYGKALISISRDEGRALGFGADISVNKCDVPRCSTEHIENIAIYKSLVFEHLNKLFLLLDKCTNGIIYCDSKIHARFISNQTGIPCVFGDTPKKERVQIVKDFNAGKIRFVLTVGCLTRGYDRQDLENIIILTNYSNECEVEQILGRLNRGTCKKTCWYNSNLNTAKPVVGKTTKIKVKHI